MITVVTITYNNFEELVQTLNSLKPALGKNVESLVINGGNCEKTKEYLKTYDGRSISEPDEGISDAFNKGIANAKGDFVAVLNSGDILTYKSYYKDALELIKNSPDIPFLYGKAIFKHNYLGNIEFIPELSSVLRKMPFAHCSMVTNKELMEKHGCFDLDYKIAMDYDLLLKIFKDNFKGQFLNTPFAFILDGTGVSSTHGNMGILECERSLKREGLYSLSTWKYFKILKGKMFARNILSNLGLINIYDRLRHGEKHS